MNSHQKAIIQKTRLFEREDPTKSAYLVMSTFALLVTSYTVSIFCPFILLKVISSIFHGLLIVRMFGMYHDYAHGAILRKSRWGELMMKAFGLYVLSPLSIWRRSHNFHHSHNSKLAVASIGSFPIMPKRIFDAATKREQRTYLLTRHPLTIFLGYFSIFLFGMAIRPMIINYKEHKDVLLALLIHVISGIAHFYFGCFTLFMFAFFIPHFISSMIGAYLFYAQHNFPQAVFNSKNDWNYVDAALRSSSYMKMPKFWAWVCANIGYHHIHHVNSKIPFYRLPEAMDKISEFQSAKETSLSLSAIIACLKLKVWDEETETLVPIKQ